MCLTLARAFDAITLPPLHSSVHTSAPGWVKQCSLVPGKPPFMNSFFDWDMCFRFQILTQIDFGKCNCFISQGPSELNVLLSAIIRVQQECLKYFSVPWLLSPNKFWLLNFAVIRTIFVTSKVYFGFSLVSEFWHDDMMILPANRSPRRVAAFLSQWLCWLRQQRWNTDRKFMSMISFAYIFIKLFEQKLKRSFP